MQWVKTGCFCSFTDSTYLHRHIFKMFLRWPTYFTETYILVRDAVLDELCSEYKHLIDMSSGKLELGIQDVENALKGNILKWFFKFTFKTGNTIL